MELLKLILRRQINISTAMVASDSFVIFEIFILVYVYRYKLEIKYI